MEARIQIISVCTLQIYPAGPNFCSDRLRPQWWTLVSPQIGTMRGHLNASGVSEMRGPQSKHKGLLLAYPRDQNSPKALCSMVFGPKSLNI